MPRSRLERFLLSDHRVSVLRFAAFFLVAVLVMLYSPGLGDWVSLDGYLEPVVWSAFLTVMPPFVVLLVGIAAYGAYRRAGFLVGWGAVAVPWVVGMLRGSLVGPVVYSFLTNSSFGGPQFGAGRLVTVVPPAVLTGFAYALPFAVVGYLLGSALRELDVDDPPSTLRIR